ncbi:MAG TPA: mandelate racemase/muconate lactonizing enzyme family protein [Xanthobacteraceae bacterium]|nr:mandelate racemase/muconate lactonizing enzyme family protein [Xanthobacteraceae bacterium]
MKIASVECLPVHSGWRKNFVFVRVATDAGVVGWGEAYSQYDRDRAIAAQVEELGRYLIGREAFHIRHILQIAFDDYAQRRGSLEFHCAASGIEQALWDILGKVARQPVYNLLGGPCRSRVRVYANGWSYRLQLPEDYARAAESVCARGFTALKLDPLPGPWRTFVPKDHIGRAVAVMRAVRQAVGAGVDVLVDVHRRLAPMHAIALADALAEFDPYWLEEPCQAENVEALAEVRRATRIPVVTGEALLTRSGFRPVFRARAVDIVNPDVANCGGILELMYIAAAAEAEAIAVSPHNYNSTTMALSATVHASACMPNFIITEYFLPFEDLGRRLCPNVLRPVDGYIALPEGPGLGLDVDEGAVRAARGKPFPARTFRTIEEEGP